MPSLLGPPDLTDQYNTPLPPEEEAGFQAWMKELSKEKQYDASKDLRDYDMRGAYLAQAKGTIGRGHLPDDWKKPNHPTFSNESIYSNPNMQGGNWSQLDDLNYSYTPSLLNMKMRTKAQLDNYFKKVENRRPGAAPDTEAATVLFPEEMGLGMRR